MKYKIVKECSMSIAKALVDLEENVEKEIKYGWKPIGGVSILDVIACQAMIKEEKM